MHAFPSCENNFIGRAARHSPDRYTLLQVKLSCLPGAWSENWSETRPRKKGSLGAA